MRVSEEGAGPVQGLGDISVVCTDVLILSSVFFDRQRQETRRVTSRSVSCFRVGVRICEDAFGKQLRCPGLEKEFLAPWTLGCGCSGVSGTYVLFSLLPLLTIQPPSRLSGGRMFLRAPSSGSSRAHT